MRMGSLVCNWVVKSPATRAAGKICCQVVSLLLATPINYTHRLTF